MATTARAYERNLADFFPLRPAEQHLLETTACGEAAILSQERPETPTDQNMVRAGFIRFLALGGDETAQVYGHGVQLQGAWIEGELNLRSVTSVGELVLCQCCFAEELKLANATIEGSLNLKGSRILVLFADRLIVRASLFLSDGFRSDGPVRLLGAKISGNWECDGGVFDSSIDADRVQVGGVVSMGADFRGYGEVCLLGAKIVGDWQCAGGLFHKELSADGAEIGGNIFLTSNFKAIGDVNLTSVRVGGDLNLRTGQFTNLILQRLEVKNICFFDNIGKISGSIDLAAARVRILADDEKFCPATAILDGFVYGAFGGNAPTTAKHRIAWLDLQSKDHSGASGEGATFRPQPWQQLRKVLREMGHYEAAREVGVEFERRKRRCGLIGEIAEEPPRWCAPFVWRAVRRVNRSVAKTLHRLYGGLTDYGYRPLKLVFVSFALWLLCTGLFYIGAANGSFAPSEPLIYQNPAYASCAARPGKIAHWTHCKSLPAAYPSFYPPVYALNVLLPVGDLGEASSWSPITSAAVTVAGRQLPLGFAVQFAVWFETLFGWAASLLLIAVLSGLIKREDA